MAGGYTIVIAAVVLTMLSAPALSITPAPPEPPLFDFGDWIIVQQPRTKDSLRLVTRGEAYPLLEIECLARSSLVGLFVQLGANGEAAPRGEVTVWNERGQRSTVQLPRTNSATLFTVFDRRNAGDGPAGIHSVFSTLRQSQKYLVLKVAGREKRFDTSRLQEAFRQFESACGKLR
jgi:hypothetical protein